MQTDLDTQRRSRLATLAGVAVAFLGALFVGVYDPDPMGGVITPTQEQTQPPLPGGEAPTMVSGDQTNWMIGGLERLHGAKVTPTQQEILPWPSVTVIIITEDNKEITRRGIASGGGQWGMTSGKTAAEVRITERGILELRPYLDTVFSGGELSTISKASVSVAMGRLMDTGHLVVVASP